MFVSAYVSLGLMHRAPVSIIVAKTCSALCHALIETLVQLAFPECPSKSHDPGCL